MAKPNIDLIQTLKKTVKRLQDTDGYQWGHMGNCNCGYLAQEITKLSKKEIHQSAMLRHGDWNEQLNDYCPTSGMPMDKIIDSMLALGLDTDDLKHLEKLSDSIILQQLPTNQRWLRHNVKRDVIIYLNTWAGLLEKQMLEKIHLPKLDNNREVNAEPIRSFD